MSEAISLNPLLDRDILGHIEARLAGRDLSPADETITLRTLAGESGLSLPVVVRLWRELSGERRRREGAPPIAVFGGRQLTRTADVARSRFGAAARYLPMEKPETALAAARPPGGVAVIALEPDSAWWLRLLAEPELAVFAVLPDIAGHGPRTAFAVASVATGPTGADETYFVTDAAAPARRVIEALQSEGLAGDLIQDTGGLKLIALAGYVQREDARLLNAPGQLKGVIGASPLPFGFQT